MLQNTDKICQHQNVANRSNLRYVANIEHNDETLYTVNWMPNGIPRMMGQQKETEEETAWRSTVCMLEALCCLQRRRCFSMLCFFKFVVLPFNIFRSFGCFAFALARFVLVPLAALVPGHLWERHHGFGIYAKRTPSTYPLLKYCLARRSTS